MSKVLFLGIPTHGHVNPTLGLVSELVKQGEEVVYFCSDEFKEKIEKTGASYKHYNVDLNFFQAKKDGQAGDGKRRRPFEGMFKVIDSSHEVIDDILYQTKDLKFDYMIHSAAFP